MNSDTNKYTLKEELKMKKTLAIILSVVMLLGVLPFGAFAADYDRAKIAANDTATIDALSEEQIASVILDWVDREIAAYSAEIEAAITEGVIASGGFDGFESFVSSEIDKAIDVQSLDDVIGYKSYLAELGGDFANLDATNLVTREAAGTDLDFIYGVIQFMADNSETFGKVFHWEEGKVFDYGKVGEYILSLDTTDADNAKIVDFYNNYLIGNDIQEKFIAEVAAEMGYTIPTNEDGTRAETFDQTISNGIIAWFSGLCETNGILSAEGLATLRAYDLRTTDIYALVKNFVALVESDNQVKIDTYYNYILDTAVRTMLKTMLGQTATVGAEAALPEGFSATYTDLALLEEVSGGTAYYQDADGAYYQVTIADGAVTACNALTWTQTLDVNFEAPTATVYTGANTDEVVQVYRPTSEDVPVNFYASEKNQALMADKGIEFAGTEVPADYSALMIDANAKALADSFGLTVAQGEEIISELVITFKEIEEFAEAEATTAAQSALEAALASSPIALDAAVSAVDITLGYNGWATEDEFICQVVVENVAVTLSGSSASMLQSSVDSAAATAVGTYVDSPVATIVVDNLSGNLNIDDAKELLDFVDTDFVIDEEPIAFSANYDAYDGVVGQVNHVLYGIVDMLVSDAGMEKLALVDGDNTNLTDNLQKICDTANDMMAAAEEVMNDEGLQDMLQSAGIDLSAVLGSLDLDALYAIDFSSVEALYVSAISMGLDILDDGTNATVTEIHTALEGLTNLDAMAVAMTDYVLGKCVPSANEKLGTTFAVPTATDAKTVADGAAKDIIMTKLVDLVYEAAVWGVGFINDKVNEVIGHVEGETNTDLPTVAFELGVEKGADWEATLAALVNRVYELADGIIIACDNTYTDTFDKISAVANAILPLGSLASNCASENFALDVNLVLNDYMFADGLAGDLEGFLGLFETSTKTDDVAAGVPVTKALVNASQHIVDSIFPGTVVADNYAASETVKEDFTSGDNDVVIASNNMDSINARKADLVPAALNLVREAGVLPYFAKCDKDHTAADLATVVITGTAATCTEAGVEDAYACAECGYIVSGGGAIAAKGHSYGDWKTTTAPTCTANGVSTRTCACGASETNPIAATGHSYGAWTVVTAAGCETTGMERRTCACGSFEENAIAATGHADADGNDACDACGADLAEEEELSFFDKIKAFFQRIIDWFKNLFS